MQKVKSFCNKHSVKEVGKVFNMPKKLRVYVFSSHATLTQSLTHTIKNKTLVFINVKKMNMF